jgi:hypothetical protein
MKRLRPQPPKGAPEGTVWFGGPVDRCRVTLRVSSDDLDPDAVSKILGCEPSKARKKREPFRTGQWSLSLTSDECGEWAVEEVVTALLKKLPDDLGIWHSLHESYEVDLFCGLFMEAANRGFVLSPETCKRLVERGLEIGFDIYAKDFRVELPRKPSGPKLVR